MKMTLKWLFIGMILIVFALIAGARDHSQRGQRGWRSGEEIKGEQLHEGEWTRNHSHNRGRENRKMKMVLDSEEREEINGLSKRIHELAEQYRDTEDESEKEALEEAVRQKVTERFELMQSIRDRIMEERKEHREDMDDDTRWERDLDDEEVIDGIVERVLRERPRRREKDSRFDNRKRQGEKGIEQFRQRHNDTERELPSSKQEDII